MKAEKRREQVLGCAAELFAERGYHQTTVEHIVTRAEIARGTFYLYFEDKRSIFDELLERFMADLRSRIIRIDPALGREVCLDLMRQNIREVLSLSMEQSSLTKILLSYAPGLDSDFDEKLLDFDREVTSLLESSLTLGQEMGVIRDCDAPFVAVCINGAFKELMYQVTVGGMTVDAEQVVEEMLGLYLHGLFTLP
jgi:AcrR family transcriptional regulator